MVKEVTVRNAARNVAIQWKGNSMESDPIDSLRSKQRGSMDIETQRESWGYLPDCDWLIFMCRAVRVLTVPLLALFISISPAQAAIESVTPLPVSQWAWSLSNGSRVTYPTADAACLSYVQHMLSTGGYYYVGTAPSQTFVYAALGYLDCYITTSTLGYNIAMITAIPTMCPEPNVNPAVKYTYNTNTRMCERTAPVTECPITGLTTDPADPNGLEALIKQYDKTEEERLLTRKLENKFDGYSLLTDKTQKAEQCLAGRIGSAIPQSDSGYKVTSAVRTLAYQAHLLAVWDKFFELQDAIRDKPAIRKLCPTLIAQVEGEMGFRLTQDPTDPKSSCTVPGRNHCIVQKPAAQDPKHTKDVAFDISRATVQKFVKILLPPRTMSTEANACNLTWGGTWEMKDPVHFLCCVK